MVVLAAYYHWETLFAMFVKITATTQIITGCVGIVTVLEGNVYLSKLLIDIIDFVAVNNHCDLIK